MTKSKIAIRKTVAHLNKANRTDLAEKLKKEAKSKKSYYETINLCRSLLNLAYRQNEG